MCVIFEFFKNEIGYFNFEFLPPIFDKFSLIPPLKFLQDYPSFAGLSLVILLVLGLRLIYFGQIQNQNIIEGVVNFGTKQTYLAYFLIFSSIIMFSSIRNLNFIEGVEPDSVKLDALSTLAFSTSAVLLTAISFVVPLFISTWSSLVDSTYNYLKEFKKLTKNDPIENNPDNIERPEDVITKLQDANMNLRGGFQKTIFLIAFIIVTAPLLLILQEKHPVFTLIAIEAIYYLAFVLSMVLIIIFWAGITSVNPIRSRIKWIIQLSKTQ